MERALVFALLLLALVPVSVTSSRFLVGDKVSGGGEQNDTSEKIRTLPPQSTPKDPPSKTKNTSLTSLKSESQNQSELVAPVQTPLEKNKTLESSSPLQPDKKDKQNNNNTLLTPPETKKPANGSETGTKTEKEGQIGNFKQGLCDDVASEKCFDENKWVACLQFPSNDSKELFLVVDNKGENEISLDINFTPTIILDTKKLHLSKTDSHKVKIVRIDSNQAANITLNAGKGDCILHISSSKTLISDWQMQFQQLTNYATTQISPIYGLYFLLFTLVIFLITFACCKVTRGRRRAQNGGSSYQQLEMGEIQPGASSAVADVAETADRWEKGWDDDWDDEEAVMARGVSVNSLSSRVNNNNNNNNHNNNSSKDGWDVDWDD